jgi:tRNA(Ile)-lysidine synthase/bifunctional protein TilS/HprT
VLKPENIYILSISGGIDSMVLLDFLYKKKYKIIVVHFNHLVRKNSTKEKKLIQKYCNLRKINFYYFELNNIPHSDFQNQARIRRKEKLKEIAFQNKTNYLITAHHLDDLAETILFKISRGSSLLGYSGMQPIFNEEKFIFLKPFLYITKKKIQEYAEKNKINFVEDYTNKLDIYTRNKIRSKIIPFLKEINNNFLKNIYKFHSQITETYKFLRNETIFFLKKQKKNILDLKSFNKLNITVKKDIILFLLEKNKVNKNFTLINNIIKGLENIKKPFIIWKLNQKFEIIKKYNFFTFQKKELEKKNNLENKKLKKKELIPSIRCSQDKKLLSNCFIIQKIYFDSNNIRPPFQLRKRKPGDILKFNFGTQKLRKFFINQKIILPERNKIWIITDQNNLILWIPKFYVNKTLGQKNFFYLGLI